jgi:hypothetical protein
VSNVYDLCAGTEHSKKAIRRLTMLEIDPGVVRDTASDRRNSW